MWKLGCRLMAVAMFMLMLLMSGHLYSLLGWWWWVPLPFAYVNGVWCAKVWMAGDAKDEEE